MRRSILAFAVAVSLAAIDAARAEAPAQSARTKIDFVQNGIGVPPADFEFWLTGRGSPGDWAVVRDTTASAGAAIEQSSRDATENRYPLAIYKPASLKNVEISASIKLISGAAPNCPHERVHIRRSLGAEICPEFEGWGSQLGRSPD